MTNAEETASITSYDRLKAYDDARRERHELPDARPGRAAKIAAIHMFAQWLIEHPEVPVPTSIMANYFLSRGDEPDLDVRYQAITDLAAKLGAEEYGSRYRERSPQFDHVVASPTTHGVSIVYRGRAFADIEGRPL